MSEVRKWYIGVYGGEAQARPCSPAEFEIINEREGRYFVLKEDYDSAAQCFLTAAEGCVAAERRERALQQRLTAADEREDALCSLAPEAELALKALNVAVSVYDVELADSARRGLRLIIAALKPAEGDRDDA
ncbi:hypothetical protein [Pseudomonas sp. WS 5079]|uniref:hypothetical protein n=1 Tax=Pseudomonas sp. WS 5079 TaxID=2717492 RepID=UPI00155816C8|nr:hypothetical protein [Pseudomonas sp. WS 5079]NMX62860.1 hypothetical protein [Pseudomonas sp. WS 5079]